MFFDVLFRRKDVEWKAIGNIDGEKLPQNRPNTG
jgi:hypothetical protein